MDFCLTKEEEQLRQQIATFVATHIMPLEDDKANYDAHENIKDEILADLREKAKAEGLWNFQVVKSRGGHGLSHCAMAACYEEASRSIFGPVTFNCAAPDDGNMMVLNKVLKTDALKETFLAPIERGDSRSAFAMTEPDGGCGSDPSLTYTTATKDGDNWVINGRKWFITGAEAADIFVVIAKTSDDKRKGLTGFLFHKDQPGWEIVRRIAIMGPEEHGGHCELKFDGLVIPDEHRLLEVGDGLKLTQIRLGPARLTHCMRWLGLAKRCLEIASEYVANRDSFGIKLIDRESVQLQLGDVAKDIQVGRLLTMNAAWKLDQGDYAKKEISIAKVHVADTLHKASDIAIQLCGAKGYSKDTILEWIYRYARQARLVDGASEVHKMVLSNLYLRDKQQFFSWDVDGED